MLFFQLLSVSLESLNTSGSANPDLQADESDLSILLPSFRNKDIKILELLQLRQRGGDLYQVRAMVPILAPSVLLENSFIGEGSLVEDASRTSSARKPRQSEICRSFSVEFAYSLQVHQLVQTTCMLV